MVLHLLARNYARYLLAVLVGILWAAAYPKMGLAAMAWFVPGLMLTIALGQPSHVMIQLGWLAGWVFHLVSLYWLLLIPVAFAPIVGWLALSAFLALYQALWVWLCCRLYEDFAARTRPTSLWERFLTNRWHRQLTWALTCAALWVSLEMIQTRLFTGFPWNLLAASQYRIVPLIQMTSVTGTVGLSFLMTWFSVSLVSALALLLFRLRQRRDWMIEIMPPVFVTIVIAAMGMRHVMINQSSSSPTVKITLVQPSIPQQTIWAPEKAMERFQTLLELTKSALTNPTDLLVWPEAAVPNLYRYDTNIHVAVTNLVRRHRVWLVLGADDASPRQEEAAPPADTPEYEYFNSSFLVDPQGLTQRVYRKRKLVMFGEYVPLARWLPFLRDFTSIHSDFTPGVYPATFTLSNLNVRFSMLICFEDVFANLTRKSMREDLDFLLNLTNNGWFGDSAAQWQHAASAVFRAVENRIPLVRCSNNGLSCWVDELGNLHDPYLPGTTDAYGPGAKTVDVPIRGGQGRVLTLYARHGDWFGWLCGIWSVLAILRHFLFRTR